MTSNLKNFTFCEYSQTIRCNPENYWIASLKDGKIVFDSWDGAIKGRYNEKEINEQFKHLIK